MKILIIAADKGGHFAPFVEEQIAALQDLKHEVLRYAVHGKGMLGYLREIPRLRQTIRTLRPDIIHAHYGLCGLLANLSTIHYQHSTKPLLSTLNTKHSTPVITTYHGSDINTPRVLRLSRIAMHLSAWNIFVSRANIRTARAEDKSFAPWAYRGDNYSLLPCGVTLSDDQLLSRAEARKRLAEANVQCTISDGKARKSVPFSEIQHHRLILFAGAFSNPVKNAKLAEEVINLSNNVSTSKVGATGGFGGILLSLQHYTRTEVNWLMCAADCLLLTSRSEGSPQVVKEAMACGCPIVSVDVGDVRERVEGIEGCYVAKSRSPQELADLLRTALQITPPHYSQRITIPSSVQTLLHKTVRCTSRQTLRRSVQTLVGTCSRMGLPIRRWRVRCLLSMLQSCSDSLSTCFTLFPRPYPAPRRARCCAL